jgi:hypothetical protein
VANALLSNAKHIEIARRYAWHVRQRRGGSKLTFSQLIPRVRLRELERIFQRRYGRLLPDDDAGRDDLILAAHHVAHLGGDAVGHIIAWARGWAPWMPQAEAREIADRVAAEPKKFTADSLAWRLRLSMIERTELKITTIGAFDCSKSERVELRKIRDREAKRAHRAKTKSGRPRGRPKKTIPINASTAVKVSIAVDAFSDLAHLAREVPEKPRDLNPSTKQNLRKISGSVKSRFDSGKGQPPVLSSGNPRAASPKMCVSTKPPSEVIDQAVEIVRQHSNISPDRQTVQRMLERFWPSYARAKTATAVRYYGKFNPDRDLRDWSMSFRITLNGEADAIDRHRQRRQKWKQGRSRAAAA